MTPQSEKGDEMGHMKDLDRRIRQGGDDAVAAACELAAFPMERLRLLSQYGDCPVADNGANRDNTPAAHDTPSEGRVQNGCTLTAEEREAAEWFARVGHSDDGGRAATLRALLERTK